MQRFDVAKSVLEDLLAVEPRHRQGLTQYGLVLGRLGKVNDAKVHMLNVAELYKDDTEAHGILGRVYRTSGVSNERQILKLSRSASSRPS